MHVILNHKLQVFLSNQQQNDSVGIQQILVVYKNLTPNDIVLVRVSSSTNLVYTSCPKPNVKITRELKIEKKTALFFK